MLIAKERISQNGHEMMATTVQRILSTNVLSQNADGRTQQRKLVAKMA